MLKLSLHIKNVILIPYDKFLKNNEIVQNNYVGIVVLLLIFLKVELRIAEALK